MNEIHKTGNFPAESVGSIMSTNIPCFLPTATLKDVMHELTTKRWDSIRTAYIVDGTNRIQGFIDVANLSQANYFDKTADLMQPVAVSLHPHDDQEKAVFLAVKDNDTTLPVIENNQLLGAVTARKIIGIMHEEHMEDALLASGIRRGNTRLHIAEIAMQRTGLIVRSRAPWLMVGLIAGLGLGLISSFFEKSLQQTIALAYFIPAVAYIADSVGTQSEAIAVRALATLKINYLRYLTKEILVGLALGAIVGVMGGVGAFIVGHDKQIGIVVGLSLLVASTIAATLAVAIPMIFRKLGKDPALGSGPLATALQDVISVVIYFLFAVLLI